MVSYMILLGEIRINFYKKQHKCIFYDTNQHKDALTANYYNNSIIYDTMLLNKFPFFLGSDSVMTVL